MQEVKPPEKPLSERVRDLAAVLFDLTVEEISGESQSHRVCHPRMAAMSTLYSLGWSLVDIGVFFGGRDHVTVSNARDRVPVLCAQDEVFAGRVQTLRSAFALPPLVIPKTSQTSVKTPI
jgi:chromosomal replication initiation ATPase DnaA